MCLLFADLKPLLHEMSVQTQRIYLFELVFPFSISSPFPISKTHSHRQWMNNPLFVNIFNHTISFTVRKQRFDWMAGTFPHRIMQRPWIFKRLVFFARRTVFYKWQSNKCAYVACSSLFNFYNISLDDRPSLKYIEGHKLFSKVTL